MKLIYININKLINLHEGKFIKKNELDEKNLVLNKDKLKLVLLNKFFLINTPS